MSALGYHWLSFCRRGLRSLTKLTLLTEHKAGFGWFCHLINYYLTVKFHLQMFFFLFLLLRPSIAILFIIWKGGISVRLAAHRLALSFASCSIASQEYSVGRNVVGSSERSFATVVAWGGSLPVPEADGTHLSLWLSPLLILCEPE